MSDFSFSDLEELEYPPKDLIYLFKYGGYFIYTSDFRNFYFSKNKLNPPEFSFEKRSTFRKNMITFFMNKDCNLNCEYCYIKNKEKKFIKFSKIKPFLDYFARINKYSSDIELNFYSHGEIFLHFSELKKIISFLKNKIKANFLIRVNTNLTILNQEILDFLKENEIKLIVSLDSPADFDLRFKNKELFEKAYNNFLLLRKHSLIDSVNCTVNKNHIENFHQHFLFLTQLKAPINLNRVHKGSSKFEISDKEYYDFLLKFYEYLFYFKNKIHLPIDSNICTFRFILNYSDDYIYSCAYFLDKNLSKNTNRFPADRFRISKISEVNQIRKINFRNLVEYTKRCKDCYYRFFCLPCKPRIELLGRDYFCNPKKIYEKNLKIYLNRFLKKYPIYYKKEKKIKFSNFDIKFSSKIFKRFFNYLIFRNFSFFKEQLLDKNKFNLIEFRKISKENGKDLQKVFNIIGEDYNILFLNDLSKTGIHFFNYASKIVS